MKLFEPLDIPGMRIPNRIMVPAMVTHLCREDGVVTDETIERYVRYARGGTGLIVVEAMAVHQVKSMEAWVESAGALASRLPGHS